MPPSHPTIRESRSGNAAPSRMRIGTRAWVASWVTKVEFQLVEPGLVPESRLTTRSRFIDTNIQVVEATAMTTIIHENQSRSSDAGNGYELAASSMRSTPAVEATASVLSC